MKFSKKFFRFWPIFSIVALSLLMLGRGAVPPADKMIYSWDVYAGVYYFRTYFAESIRHGIVPFWDPYSFSGTPMLAQPSLGPFYPPNWLFIVLPFNYALSFFLLLHLIIAGSGMYLMMRRWCDTISSIYSSAVFILSGLMASRIFSGHIEYVATTALIPVILFFILRVFARGNSRDILGATITIAFQILAGNQIVFIFTMELIGIYFLCLVFILIRQKKYREIYGMLVRILVITMLAIGISAVQLIPAIELSRETVRGEGLSYETASIGSYDWNSLKMLAVPDIFGEPFYKMPDYRGPWPSYFEFTYFPGKVTIVLAVFGIVVFGMRGFRRKRWNREFFIFGVAFLFFLLMSLGPSGLLHPIIYKFIPFYQFFRIPVRHMVMGVFLLAVLSGLTVALIKYRYIRLLMVGILIFELAHFNWKFIYLELFPTAKNDTKLVQFLQTQPGEYRSYLNYQTWDPMRSVMDLNSGPYYRLPTIGGYNAVMMGKYYRFIDAMNKRTVSDLRTYPSEIPPIDPRNPHMNFLGVKYIVNPIPTDSIGRYTYKPFALSLEGNGYTVYENPTAKQRFFLTGKVNTYPTEDMLEHSIREGEDLTKTTLFLQKDIDSVIPKRVNCDADPGTVTVISASANSIKLRVQAVCDSILSTSEVNYPGWKVLVNGTDAPLLNSNIAFRSVFIPKGQYDVEFWYDPKIFVIGGGVSFVSLAILILYLSHLSYLSHL